MESIISTFHIDWKIIVAQAINFGVVFVVLYIFALKPLSKLMKERSEKIEGGITNAKKSGELMQKASEEYERNTIKLKQVAVEAKKELNKELEQLRADNLEKMKSENEEWTKKRAVQMEADKKILVDGAKAEIADLVVKSVEKLLGNKHDPAYEAKVIKELNNL